MSRLYVGNLAHETTEVQLRDAFAAFGEVSSVKIVSDRRGRQKGFAYVQMADAESADRALESLKGTQINGRTLHIAEDTPRKGGFTGRRRR
ncbi:MAG TPA: RNA-binding protein [Dehalococcoidia bacterium]|nr:RNA-binding protein [Dehalococcoidia bacterium]